MYTNKSENQIVKILSVGKIQRIIEVEVICKDT